MKIPVRITRYASDSAFSPDSDTFDAVLIGYSDERVLVEDLRVGCLCSVSLRNSRIQIRRDEDTEHDEIAFLLREIRNVLDGRGV
jgi:hypothetical protein